MNITDKFLDRIFSISKEGVSEDSIKKIKFFLIDTLGVTLAGAKDLKDKDIKFINLINENEGHYFPIGLKKGTSLSYAIFLNGLNSHYLELDDGIRYGVIHPSAPLFSALIPLVLKYNISWENFIIATTTGYETAIRLAYSMQPSHYNKGYHPTAISMVPAVSLAIGILLNWNKKIIKDAFGVGCNSASGTLKVLEDISELKPYNSAQAAFNGYNAAMFAKAGFSSPSDPLGGKEGFLKMFSDEYNEDILLGNNNFLYLDKIYQKPYASCRHTHPEVEACLELRESPFFEFNDIHRIIVKTYKGVIGKHDGKEISGESSARMSIPYSIAVALKTGKVGIEEFSPSFISDSSIISLLDKIEIFEDEYFSAQVPEKRIASVLIIFKNGEKLKTQIDYPKGEPENPFSESELFIKFEMLTKYAGINHQIAISVFNNILYSQNPDLSEIIRRLSL